MWYLNPAKKNLYRRASPALDGPLIMVTNSKRRPLQRRTSSGGAAVRTFCRFSCSTGSVSKCTIPGYWYGLLANASGDGVTYLTSSDHSAVLVRPNQTTSGVVGLGSLFPPLRRMYNAQVVRARDPLSCLLYLIQAAALAGLIFNCFALGTCCSEISPGDEHLSELKRWGVVIVGYLTTSFRVGFLTLCFLFPSIIIVFIQRE